MRSGGEVPHDSEGRTFIDRARRAQIITAAIDTIAELGYGQASLTRIAQRAGTSKGVVTYHFTGKDEIIQEVITAVLARGSEYMTPRIMAETTGVGMLRAYIESNLAYMRDNRNHLLAVVEIAVNARNEDGSRSFDAAVLDDGLAALQRLIAGFQSTDEFRPDFNAHVMAVAIRGAIDAVPPRLARDTFDIDSFAKELAALFVQAVRANPEGTS
jgi:TetR/AcrR family transcriptional regulator, fatty acid metabolism regulator protein